MFQQQILPHYPPACSTLLFANVFLPLAMELGPTNRGHPGVALCIAVCYFIGLVVNSCKQAS